MADKYTVVLCPKCGELEVVDKYSPRCKHPNKRRK